MSDVNDFTKIANQLVERCVEDNKSVFEKAFQHYLITDEFPIIKAAWNEEKEIVELSLIFEENLGIPN